MFSTCHNLLWSKNENKKNLTIIFTDIKGFTSTTATYSRRQLRHLLDLQDEIVKPVIQRYHGQIVKTTVDAYLIIFESPTNAVLCGMKIQEEVNAHNANSPEEDRFELRIAINTGEVNIRNNDVFDELVNLVNITARIENIAEPNEVYFTESVYLAMKKTRFQQQK